MSDRWLYRISGREFGPVSLDLVRTLVATGTIAPDDEVRDSARSNWILACSASELRGSIKMPISDLVAERRAVRDEWFCRGATGEIGPLKLSDLIELAANGELEPEEEVKAWAEDYWRQVRSIRRLVELLPFPNRTRGPAVEARGTAVGSHRYVQDRRTEGDAPLRFEGAIHRSTSGGKRGPISVGLFHADEANIIPFPGTNPTRTTFELTDSISALPTPTESVSACDFPRVEGPPLEDDPLDGLDRQDVALSIANSQRTGLKNAEIAAVPASGGQDSLLGNVANAIGRVGTMTAGLSSIGISVLLVIGLLILAWGSRP